MPTPGSYYDVLPERLEQHRRRARSTRSSTRCASCEILVDGDKAHQYLLQIFLKDAAGLLRRSRGRAVLLRDHPAQGRPGLRRRQLPRAVREHRARAEGRRADLGSSMLERLRRRDAFPRKHHIALRDAEGALRYEECLTRDGLRRAVHHRLPPAAAAHAAARATAGTAGRCPRTPPTGAPAREAPLPDRRSWRARAAPPVDARVPLLFNDDVTLGMVRPDRAGPGLLRATATATISSSSTQGGGVLPHGARRRALRRGRLRLRAARAAAPVHPRRAGRSAGCRSSARRAAPAAAVAQRGRPAADGRALLPPRLPAAGVRGPAWTRASATWW